MDVREVPSTDHDIMVRIWTILEGTNGSGLITRFGCLEKDVADIKSTIPNLWTKDQHAQSLDSYEVRKDLLINRRRVSNREWLLGLGVVLVPVLTLIMAHYWH